jgi:hypothetical protein
MTKAKDTFDVRSATRVLTYVGPGIVGGIPADDLSAHQLARIVWGSQGDSRPATPDDVKQADIATLRDALIATGDYKAVEGKSDE